MSYAVKEIFKTLQGEGARAGRAAVFCRFAGCNLWSGREENRASAICTFCDTDFVGTNGVNGARFESAQSLAAKIETLWGPQVERRYVVCTGGEPLLQLNSELIDALHQRHFEIAIETNGTLDAPAGIDWICVSPKAGSQLKLDHGSELKLIYPQAGAHPSKFVDMNFGAFWLQPMDGPNRIGNTAAAVDYCLADPRWRLSVQAHKYIGIP